MVGLNRQLGVEILHPPGSAGVQSRARDGYGHRADEQQHGHGGPHARVVRLCAKQCVAHQIHRVVGIATLYRHFPTRAALYDACAIVFLERIETLLDDALDGFEDNPVEHFESFVWALVESGVGILAAALAADSSDGGLGERRDVFMGKVQLLIDAAVPHGIVAPGESPMQLATELVVATRPLAAPLADILPDVRDRLVRHLMAGWRTTA